MEIERTDFSNSGLQIYRNELSFFSRESCFNGSDLLEIFMIRRILKEIPWFVVATDRRTEEAELCRFTDDEPEFLRRNFGLGAFLHSERCNTERA